MTQMTRRAWTAGMLAAGVAHAVRLDAQPERTQWFREARFGMFIHFGLYALLERGEWVMYREGIPVGEYEKLAAKFNPARTSARDWVALARAAGQRYITITAKHHDGFCLFCSKLTDYNITRSPYGRDLILDLAEECERQKMPLSFYYSLMDWHHPAYRATTASRSPVNKEFRDFLLGQVRELLTNYGRIAGIWFDGDWDHPPEQWGSADLLDLIRKLQPQALVNNRAGIKGDFTTPEQELGAKPKKGDDTPREVCMTINDNWGYSKPDQRYKSSTELIQMLAQAAGSGSNLLLNVGPMGTGAIQPEIVERLRAIGTWLAKNGESIYGTQPAFKNYYHGTASTQRGNRTYFHIFNWQPGSTLRIDLDVRETPKRVFLLESSEPMPYKRNAGGGLSIESAHKTGSAAVTVIVVES